VTDYKDRAMSATKIKPFTQWADVTKTERFVRIVPLSGYRLVQHEYDAYAIYLEPHASDEALGQALLDTLERSRFIPPRPAFADAEKYMRYYWQKDFTQRFKTRRQEYKNMDWCRTKRSGGKIEIHPHQRDMPDYFLDHPPERTVVIPATANVQAVGAAARLALDRCENTFLPAGSESSDAADSSVNDISGAPADGENLRSASLEEAFERKYGNFGLVEFSKQVIEFGDWLETHGRELSPAERERALAEHSFLQHCLSFLLNTEDKSAREQGDLLAAAMKLCQGATNSGLVPVGHLPA
jgi:CDI immunity protein